MTAGSISFPAMGGSATVIVAGPRSLLASGAMRLADLEAKWSRFLPASEVSRLNRSRAAAVPVSADTRLLVERAVTAWTATGGTFDPGILDTLVAWGYDRSFDDIGAVGSPSPPAPAPGLDRVAVDHAAGTVCLGGAGFDPGGIGKGLAADVVATELVQHGATAALVDVGGDLRLAGSPPGGGWVVGIEDPASPDRDLGRVALTGGALATSSTRRRRWLLDGGDAEAHHLIDPDTGAPAAPTLAGVSVLAGEAWWAEALTKAVLIGGLPVGRLTALGASGIGRSLDGAVVGTADLVALAEHAA